MQANQLMSKPCVTCHVNDTLSMAAHLMWDHDCGALAVVNDEGTLVGMLTDRDICMAAFTQGRPLDAILVNIAMATNVIATREDDAVADIEDRMASHQIRRVPVVNRENKPVGMLTLNDIARDCVHSKVMRGHNKLLHTLGAICEPRQAEHAA